MDTTHRTQCEHPAVQRGIWQWTAISEVVSRAKFAPITALDFGKSACKAQVFERLDRFVDTSRS